MPTLINGSSKIIIRWKSLYNYLKQIIRNHCFRHSTLDFQKKHSGTFYTVYKDFQDCGAFRDHPFSTYAKFSIKVAFLTPDTHMYVCISGAKKNFTEKFACVLNGSSRF